jgi:hypothetical protein
MGTFAFSSGFRSRYISPWQLFVGTTINAFDCLVESISAGKALPDHHYIGIIRSRIISLISATNEEPSLKLLKETNESLVMNEI